MNIAFLKFCGKIEYGFVKYVLRWDSMTQNAKKNISKCVVIVVICFVVEMLISNFTAISLLFGGVEEKKLDIGNELYFTDGWTKVTNEDGSQSEEEYITIKNINTKMKNICITLTDEYYEFVDVGISFTDDNFSYQDGFDYNSFWTTMYAGSGEKTSFNVSSFGEVKELRLNIGGSLGKVIVDSVVLNQAPDFSFSPLRFLFLSAVGIIVFFGFWKIKVTDSDNILMIIVAAIMCLAVVSVSLKIATAYDVAFLDQYPAENISGEDQYRQLFEAFKKGQLYLDIDFDAEKFEELNNPYDRSERNEYNLHGDFWDRAYYNGKLYSYFGAAPVFTVYYPVNILTGKVPTTLLVSTIMCIYAVIFISLLYMEFIKRFCKDVPIVLAILGEIALLFGSLIFAVAMELQFYYTAVLSGIGCVAAFFYFILKAYFETKSFKKRLVFLILSGISVVLIVASRPTLVLYCLAAIVPALFILTDKNEELKKKIAYVCSIGVPVIIGAALIMIYNYRRFDNPFEFGFNYQLTVSIAKANTITLAMIPATLYHYFIQQPNFTTKFPYFEMKSRTLENYSRFSYTARTMGILNYPLTWGIFLLPFNLRKKDKFKTAFLLTFAGLTLIMAFIDMCKAGSHYRYTTDILMPIAIIAIVGLFNGLAKLKNVSKRAYVSAYISIALVMLVTIVIGYLMIFTNERRMLLNSYPIVAYQLKNL